MCKVDTSNPRKRPADCIAATAPKQRRLNRKTVRFSVEKPEEFIGNDYSDGLTQEETAATRSQIWYSRKDFDGFLRDRVQTLRVWKSLKGNLSSDLMDHYCLRGLELYQNPSLNSEIHAHRYIYHETVMREQERQRRAGNIGPVNITKQVGYMSAWALQRSQRQAQLDALEAQGKTVPSVMRTSSPRPSRRRASSANTGVPTIPSSPKHNKRARRSSLPSQVNVDQLKMWNAQLLQKLTKKATGTVVETKKDTLQSLLVRTRAPTKCTPTPVSPTPPQQSQRYRDSLGPSVIAKLELSDFDY